MNAIDIVKPKVAIPNKSSTVGPQQEATSFSSVFAHLIGGKDSETVNASQDVELKSEDLKSDDLAGLLAALFGQIPLQEGFMNVKVIDQNLLGQLPEALQVDVKKLLAANPALEDLVKPGTAASKAELTALILSLVSLQENGKIPEPLTKPLLASLSKQASEVFQLEQLKPQQTITGLMTQLASKLGEEIVNNRATGASKFETLPTQLGKNQTIIAMLEQHPGMKLKQVITDVNMLKNTNQGLGKELKQVLEQKPSVDSTKPKGLLLSANGRSIEAKVEGKEHVTNLKPEQLLNFSAFKEQAPLNKLEQYVLHVTKPDGQQQPNEQLLNQIRQIISASSFKRSGGTSELAIKLSPEHLGTLSIKLTQVNGEMIAKIVASTQTAKDLIESNLGQLKHMLSSQHIPLDKVEVNVGGPPPSLQQQQMAGGDSQGRDQDEDEQERNEQTDGQAVSFEDELLNLTI